MNSDSIYEDARSKIENEPLEEIKYTERENDQDSDIYEDADCHNVERVKGGKNQLDRKLSSSIETAFDNNTVKSGCCNGPQKTCIII